jgi:four helix bundle protein
MSGYAKNFTDLEVYREATAVMRRIFQVTKAFPREEAYALTDQLRRASRSIGAQVAEAWGKRRYERHFISKLTDADAEQLETQHWIGVAADCGYLSTVTASELLEQLASIGRMLNSMIGKAHRFCGETKK